MRLRCPNCGHAAGLFDFANEESARQAVYLAADLPKSLGKPVMRYIGLFRPAERHLRWDRILKLLQQLKTDIDAGRIERHSRIWPAPEANWSMALNTVLEKADNGTLKLPLKNHGYLYEIISSEQNSIETREEQKIEEKRQQAKHRAPKKQTVIQTEDDKTAGAEALNLAFKQLGRNNPARTATKRNQETSGE